MMPKNLENSRLREKNKNWKSPNYAIAAGLQRQVANAFNLFLNYKYYHWQTGKPFFRDLNIIFDEFAAETYNTIDHLTERIKSMNLKRVRLVDFPRMATVKPAEKETNVRRMIEEAIFNELIVIREMREIFKKSQRVEPASANVLKKLLQTHEKHGWWLRYILEKRQWLFEKV
jgi:starvation-inducible DNA-binding protein